ncbi:hypothetical protein GALMADRAFT_235922 [Galerina marginata CBS 339.88]|uniref:Uncharacterized protein n=1 Tax=Galerina marginata (strain CBS 339.88) TaxID=685588 RepID=A0A067TMR0_GALM3|nr:hypothetical protein GALMADRAFT_235922 [Galerina marginata CBS 339.88]
MSYSKNSYSIFPTTPSSGPSFNLFIPTSSISSRETHEMYEEFGFVLRPSNRQTTCGPTKSKSSKFSSTKSRSSLRKWLGGN